jgi:very-short-patch-repair endonuclease
VNKETLFPNPSPSKGTGFPPNENLSSSSLREEVIKRNFEWADPLLYGLLKSYARENRKNQTEEEEFLWRQLKGNVLGVKFKRQLVIKNYIADFVCPERMLVIEVDGGYHYRPEQMEWDAYRTEELEKLGFRVLRFRNESIIMEIENVLKIIQECLDEYAS